MKKKRINEWSGGVGAGFSGMSGVRGGAINRGGFGGGNNTGLNTMYVYQIKPLNHSLEPTRDNEVPGEQITPGKVISGQILNMRDDKFVEGVLMRIEKAEDGSPKCYVILDPKTSNFLKLDPTTVNLIEKNQPSPLDIITRKENIEKLKTGERVMENKLVSESIQDYMTE